MPAGGDGALRELSGGVAAGAGADAAARRRGVCVCPCRRRFRRRGRRVPRRSGSRGSTQWRTLRQRRPCLDDRRRPAVGQVRPRTSEPPSSRCTTRSHAAGSIRSLFDDLLSAFAQDVTTTRYETWGGGPRLLSAIGQPGRAAGARDRRRARRENRAALRRRVHRVAARPTSGRTSATDWRDARSTLRAVGPVA